MTCTLKCNYATLDGIARESLKEVMEVAIVKVVRHEGVLKGGEEAEVEGSVVVIYHLEGIN